MWHRLQSLEISPCEDQNPQAEAYATEYPNFSAEQN
jgi:hypothetical protein